MRGKRIAVIGTVSSGVQIAGALSAEAENLEVFQRTPAWSTKIDFDMPRWLRGMLRLPGVVPASTSWAGWRWTLLVAPIVTCCRGCPGSARAVLPLYDGRAGAVPHPAARRGRRPGDAEGAVPATAFSPTPGHFQRISTALNNPTTHLITTPIERITAPGPDRRRHRASAELIVLATGYELWTDRRPTVQNDSRAERI